MSADSRNLFMTRGWEGREADPALLLRLVIPPHQIAVCHAADGVVRSGDHFVAAFQATEDLEVFVAGDAHLDGDEFRLAATHDEHTLGFLARLTGFQLRRDGNRLRSPS